MGYNCVNNGRFTAIDATVTFATIEEELGGVFCAVRV
jgi:hypothetical protein